MEPFRFHIYVCTQQKPEGAVSCPASGSFGVLQALDQELQQRGLGNDVQITTCGCVGLCDEGPVMVAYPEGVWYRRVQASDVAEIVRSHFEDGKAVARLAWDDAAAMRAMSIEHNQKFRQMLADRDKSGVLPDNLEQMARGFMASRCLLTALELDIFTEVGDGATADQVATRTKCSPRSMRTLLNALASFGLLRKHDEQYTNTPDTSRFFTQDSKDNHRNGMLHTANNWHRWSTLTDAVRTGKPIPVQRAETRGWTANFIAGMQRNAKLRAPLVVKQLGTHGVRRILDLGGGSGAYSIAFAKASPEIQCDMIDLPEVVAITDDYIQNAGVSKQVTVRPGDMLSAELGTGYDLVMLNAICHMFSEEQNRTLFGRAHEALAPGGRLAMQDFILNPDHASPQHAALFAINMLVATESGATYTEAEYTAWMKAAGFSNVSRLTLPGPSDLILGTK